jgi:hypothetical protein
MPGVGNLLKQTQVMQCPIEAFQADKDARERNVTASEGAEKKGWGPPGNSERSRSILGSLGTVQSLSHDTILVVNQDAELHMKILNINEMQKMMSMFLVPVIF